MKKIKMFLRLFRIRKCREMAKIARRRAFENHLRALSDAGLETEYKQTKQAFMKMEDEHGVLLLRLDLLYEEQDRRSKQNVLQRLGGKTVEVGARAWVGIKNTIHPEAE